MFNLDILTVDRPKRQKNNWGLLVYCYNRNYSSKVASILFQNIYFYDMNIA